MRASRRRYRSYRIKEDVTYRLAINLRSRLYLALKTNAKTGSAVRDLGCSIEELKAHLESCFYPRSTNEAMSWGNYGRGGWQIDHIEPLFMLSNGKTVKELCHYSNLQPLWGEDNLQKRDRDLQALGIFQ